MIYFASDFHLGMDAHDTSSEREKKIVRWLDHIAKDAEAIYLVGDIFDYWFEYKSVIPKGYTRLLGKLAELRDKNIPIYFFTGNHDMWMFNYFEEELGIPIFRKPIVREIKGKTFFIGHGDGLGPGDHGYKFIKRVFANKTCQWLFARIHPNLGIGMMRFFSGTSRDSQAHKETDKYLGDDKEWLVLYSNRKLDTLAADFFVFGHRHLPLDIVLKNGKSRYINLGDWWSGTNSYAMWDGQVMLIMNYGV
jgi:UDP-2,3-diacylglucosamine hydrolase